MSAQGKFADDGATLQNLFVELFVFLGIAHVDSCAEDSDSSAADGHGALMADRVDAARHAADDYEAAGGEVAAEAFRHLRAVEGRAPGAYNAEAGEVQDLGVAANVKQHGRVVNLQERLGVFGFGPVEQTAAVDVAGRGEFFFGALKRFFLEDGLGDWSGQAASFEVGEWRAENRVGRAEAFQQPRGQTGCQAGR